MHGANVPAKSGAVARAGLSPSDRGGCPAYREIEYDLYYFFSGTLVMRLWEKGGKPGEIFIN